MAGCGSKPPKSTPLPGSKPPENDGKIETALTKGGSATRYSEKGERKALWTVRWGDAELAYDSKGNVGGEMNGVAGRLFQKGKEASLFNAGSAIAEFGTQNLKLTKGVRVKFDDPAATIECDHVDWNPELERIEAHGKVMMQTGTLRLGPFETLYASPDLTEISTPDLFRKTK